MKFKLLFIVFCVATFFGCSTNYKVKQYKKFAYDEKNRNYVAEVCNNIFPCKPIATEIEKKVEVEKEVIKGDSIPCPTTNPNKPQTFVKCPDIEVKHTNTNTKETSTILDTRKEQLLDKKFQERKNQLEKEYQERRELMLSELKTCTENADKLRAENVNLSFENSVQKNSLKSKNKVIWILSIIIILYVGYKALKLYLKLKNPLK